MILYLRFRSNKKQHYIVIPNNQYKELAHTPTRVSVGIKFVKIGQEGETYKRLKDATEKGISFSVKTHSSTILPLEPYQASTPKPISMSLILTFLRIHLEIMSQQQSLNRKDLDKLTLKCLHGSWLFEFEASQRQHFLIRASIWTRLYWAVVVQRSFKSATGQRRTDF